MPHDEVPAPPRAASREPVKRRSGFSGSVARLALGVAGWRVVGTAPDLPKCVLIFAPHTSNWDFPLLLAVRTAFARRVYYLAKHTLFRFPLAGLLRWSGAIAVEREQHHQLVSALTQTFRERPEFWLAMSPEGTRHETDHWRSGFYHVARGARVPVVPAFIDARRKECGLGEPIELTGDVEADLDRLRAFYANKHGIRPHQAGQIRFLGEPEQREPED